MNKIGDKFKKYDFFKKRFYGRMPFLLLPMIFSSCKSHPLTSSPEASLASENLKSSCAASNPSPLMDRLVQFRSHGVAPYLSCPYQSEWAAYPYYYLDGDKNEFRNWIIRIFNDLEIKSSQADKPLFTDRYEFFTIVMGEGLGELLDSSAGYVRVITDGSPMDDPDIAVKIPSNTPKKLLQDPRTMDIPGFGILGTDWFGAEFPELRKKAFAKPYIGNFVENTHFVNSNQFNEHGENVVSADFKSLDIGLNAFAAVYLERRQMYLEDSKTCLGSISNDEDTRMFWSYYYFRRPSEAKSKLCSSRGKIPNARPEEDGEHPKNIPIQCLKRVATKKFLSQEKVLD